MKKHCQGPVPPSGDGPILSRVVCASGFVANAPQRICFPGTNEVWSFRTRYLRPASDKFASIKPELSSKQRTLYFNSRL